MSNTLTGDYDAVLELSGATLTRLSATMHQNAGADPARPELPHVGYFRIEGGSDAPGVRGSVAVQIGVPQVALIHGASDRFRLHIGIRARYRADPGSTALADILHGTVRAEYRLEEVDPSCFGWRSIAADYLWARVIKDTVIFNGVLLNDSAPFGTLLVFDEARVKQQVERLLATLLDTGFAPRPHKVAASLRRFRSLAAGVGMLRAAVAIPVGLDGEAPAGDLASINALFLDGHDFGLAVSRESIMARVEPRLRPLVGIQRDFHIHGDAGIGGGLEVDYHVRIDGVTAEWIGPLSIPFFLGGLIRIRASGQGWCSRLYRSGVFNVGSISASDLRMSFSVDQFLLLGFDPGAERLTVTTFGTPAVTLSYDGPFASYVTGRARETIAGELQSRLGGAVAQAQDDLAFLTAPARKAPLIDQLRQIDAAAAARFTDAAFRSEGLILRGTIALSHRHPPRSSFEKTPAADGFDAIESWIPGGRIDSFEWTWRWFTSGIEGAPGPPGADTLEESFILRRPTQRSTKFAASINLEQPLPGLDGPGRLCLVIRGVQVDHDTGDFVPVTSVMDCAQFGYEFRIPALIGLYMRLHDPLAGLEATKAAEIGVLRLGATDPAASGSNTLVLYLGDAWHEDAVAVLRAGLDQCRREGAGLLVALLFKEGKKARCEDELQGCLRELAETLAAPLMVSEDVRGGWAEALALPVDGRGLSWRLIAPDGRISWSHDGRADAGLLAAVLDERLVASLPPGLGRIGPGVEIGVRLPIELVTPHCPPVPLSRFATTGTRLIFVHRERAAAVAQIARRSVADPEPVEAPPYVAIVVEGASAQEAEALAKAWKLDIPIFPDPAGAITRQAGVRLSPSTLILDDAGRLASWQPGVELGVGQAETDRDCADREDAS
jgi:hypothetical protein